MNQLNTWYKSLPPAIKALLTINVVLFVLWIPLSFSEGLSTFFYQHLTLQANDYQAFKEPWQLITYNFLHLKGDELQGLISLAISMMFMVVVGREYEEMHGSHRLFAVYMIGGIGGGILAITLKGVFPELLSERAGPAIVSGAMSAVLAIMMNIAILYPYKRIGLLLVGPVRLLYLVLGYLVLDMFFFSSGAEVYAHLGGALFGFMFAKAESSGMDMSSWALYFFGRSDGRRSSPYASAEKEGFLNRLESWLAAKGEEKGGKKGAKKQTGKERTWRGADVEVDIAETSMEGEVDRILDKISAEGYDALTAEEKRILYEASRR